MPRAGRRRHAVAPLVGCLLALWFAGCAELMSRWPGSGGSEAPGEVPAETEAETRAETRAIPEPAAPPGELERLPLTPEEAADVESLLARAARATEQDHLTYPSEGSALALYDRVRILDPANDEARRGLERIVERYLELAMSAADQRRFSYANAMLDRARLVDPQHPGIDPTRAHISMLTEAERRVIRLDGERLRDQDPAFADTLRQAGIASRANGCRARIVARTDSEGRWIYQRMSEAPGEVRIRAELDIGSPPRVEVLCFPESE